jgi:hypothetical protein
LIGVDLDCNVIASNCREIRNISMDGKG